MARIRVLGAVARGNVGEDLGGAVVKGDDKLLAGDWRKVEPVPHDVTHPVDKLQDGEENLPVVLGRVAPLAGKLLQILLKF